MKKNSKKAFTLAEMMTVMLILSIITVASLPVITRRTSSTSSSGSDIWKYVTSGPGANSDIYYGTGDTQGVAIGVSSLNGDSTRLMLNTPAASTMPFMIFKNNNTELARFKVDGNSNMSLGLSNFGALGCANNLAIGNSTLSSLLNNAGSGGNVAVGDWALSGDTSGSANTAFGAQVLQTTTTGNYNTGVGHTALYTVDAAAIGNTAVGASTVGSDSGYSSAFGLRAHSTGVSSVALGCDAYATGSYSVAIGTASAVNGATETYSVAIGYNAKADGSDEGVGVHSIAIGSGASSNAVNATAIGHNASATGWQSTAIGAGAKAVRDHQIVIGTANGMTYDTVYVPGALEIGNMHDLPAANTYDGTTNTLTVKALRMQSTGIWRLFASGCTGGDCYNPDAVYSDRRLKNIFALSNSGLAQIRQLDVYDFTFKKDKTQKHRIGVIAQDLQKVLPNAVVKDEKGYLMIQENYMFYAMLNSIKQLDGIVQKFVNDVKVLAAKVQTLDDKIIALFKVDKIHSKKIKELEAENKALEKRLERLEHKLK